MSTQLSDPKDKPTNDKSTSKTAIIVIVVIVIIAVIIGIIIFLNTSKSSKSRYVNPTQLRASNTAIQPNSTIPTVAPPIIRAPIIDQFVEIIPIQIISLDKTSVGNMRVYVPDNITHF